MAYRGNKTGKFEEIAHLTNSPTDPPKSTDPPPSTTSTSSSYTETPTSKTEYTRDDAGLLSATTTKTSGSGGSGTGDSYYDAYQKTDKSQSFPDFKKDAEAYNKAKRNVEESTIKQIPTRPAQLMTTSSIKRDVETVPEVKKKRKKNTPIQEWYYGTRMGGANRPKGKGGKTGSGLFSTKSSTKCSFGDKSCGPKSF
jgi:hypothetical protein